MKVKKEYVILAVVIFTLAGYLLVKKSNRLHYTLPQTPTIAQNDISRLELKKTDQRITLNKKDGAWFIMPGDYPADKAKIDRIIKTITGFSINTLISESGDYLRYDLTDDKKVAVQVFGKDGPLFSFSVGKHAPTFQHTFVTIAGDKKVYLAQGNFRSDFEQSAEDLRDKHVLSFSQKTLSAIEITDDGKTWDIKKNTEEKKETKEKAAPAAAARWTDADGKMIPESAINDLFSELTGLQCESYLEGKKKEDLKDPILVVDLKGDKNATLSIFEKSDNKAASYPAISSTNAYPFSLQKYKIELIRKAIKEIHAEKSQAQPNVVKKSTASK
jgi:Domain of unknown function (DUF4340)